MGLPVTECVQEATAADKTIQTDASVAVASLAASVTAGASACAGLMDGSHPVETPVHLPRTSAVEADSPAEQPPQKKRAARSLGSVLPQADPAAAPVSPPALSRVALMAARQILLRAALDEVVHAFSLREIDMAGWNVMLAKVDTQTRRVQESAGVACGTLTPSPTAIMIAECGVSLGTCVAEFRKTLVYAWDSDSPTATQVRVLVTYNNRPVSIPDIIIARIWSDIAREYPHITAADVVYDPAPCATGLGQEHLPVDVPNASVTVPAIAVSVLTKVLLSALVTARACTGIQQRDPRYKDAGEPRTHTHTLAHCHVRPV